MLWAFPQPEQSPYQLEWDDLINAIRKNQPYNEVKRGAIASMVTSMGRMAAHTGQIITFDQMLNCEHERFVPGVAGIVRDGILAGVAVGYAMYAGLLRVPMRWFFAATGVLVLLLAAGMELDTRFGSLCARAQDDPQKPFPTFALALALFAFRTDHRPSCRHGWPKIAFRRRLGANTTWYLQSHFEWDRL